MDFLQKAYGQVLDALRPMSAGARMTTGLLLIVVVASLVYLFRYQGTTADAYLFHASVLEDSEITDILGAFSEKGLSDWTVEGNRIRVPRSKRSEYLAAASEANVLPESLNSVREKMFDGGIFETSQQRRLREKYATKRELEKMLKEMKGVAQANVQFREKQKPGLLGGTEDYALVAVRTTNKRPLSGEIVEAIRNSSASALGMEPESVTVTDTENGRAYRGGADLAQNVYVKNKEILEASFEKKIYDQLASYPGVIVNVNVDIESLMQHETDIVKYTDPTTYETQNESEEQTSRNVAVGGPPGVAANGFPNTGGSVATTSSSPDNSKTITREQSRSIVGREHTKRVLAPFTPTKITAAITLPDTYPLSVWKLRNPPIDGEEPKQPAPADLKSIQEETNTKIQNLVKNLLPPVPPGADPYPEIAVAFTPQLPVEQPKPPGMVELAGAWLSDNWQSIAMIIAALIGLVLLRGMIKASQKAASEAAAQPALQLATTAGETLPADDVEEDEDGEAEVGVLRAQFQANGPNLQDELSELVREDPDSAANVLRAWIGDAA